MNIFQKMSAVTNELQTVAKNLTVATSKTSSYKAVSERDIIDAVKPLELKHGIYSYPYDRQIIESQTLESESEYQGKIVIDRHSVFALLADFLCPEHLSAAVGTVVTDFGLGIKPHYCLPPATFLPMPQPTKAVQTHMVGTAMDAAIRPSCCQ